MNTHRQKIIASIIVSISFAATHVKAASLNEIYQRAVNADHEFLGAKATLSAERENKKIGRAGLLPNITGNAEYSSSDLDRSPRQTLNSDGTPIDPSDTSISVSDGDSWTASYGATLTQPLFNLSAWYGYKQGKTLASLAETNFAGEQQSLIIRTANAYFEVLRAFDNLETAKAEEAAFGHQLEQTKQRFAVGLTAITGVHEAQAVYDSATAVRLTTEGNLGIAFEGLEVLTGQAYTELSPLAENFTVQPPAPRARQDWVDLALKNNVTLIARQLGLQNQTFTVKTRQAAFTPTVSGFARYNNTTNGGGPQENITIDGPTIGVQLNVPLFAGGANAAGYRQEKQRLIVSQELKNKTQRDIVQLTRSLHLSVMTSVATVKARKQAIVSNRSALEATQAGYEVGTRDLVDVLNAQRGLYSAERNYHNALYTYILDSLKLKQAAGVLSDQDITALEQWLDKTKIIRYLR